MEVERFSTGRVRPKAASRGPRRYLPGAWSDETLPVNVFLVHHPQGLCLFDTGQTANAASPGYLPWWHPFLRLARFELGPEDEIGSQLGRRGIDPGSVRWVVLSHLHTDHIGGVGAFPAAEVIVSRTEWSRAEGISGRLRGYAPQHWPLAEPVLVELSGPPVGPFTGSFDVAGDGRLLLVPTPGHTPGHISLIAWGAVGTGGFFLGGDVARTAVELPAPIAGFCSEERLAVLLAHDDDI
jgi:glyoxylase-like metal-dependent hydrolase (beta-lactamase superfamily II)